MTVSGDMVMENLSDQDLALLHTKFVVPMAVGDILRGDEALDETSEYVLNTVIGDLHADTALLCLALCGQRMAAHCDHLPAARMLRAESDRVVEDYGSLWLAKEKETVVIDPAAAAKALRDVPEDLEAMAHLLDAMLGEMEQPHSPAARLCDLLAVQAHEHMDFAEAQIESVQMQLALPERAPRQMVSASHTGTVGASGNIVPFPALRQS